MSSIRDEQMRLINVARSKWGKRVEEVILNVMEKAQSVLEQRKVMEQGLMSLHDEFNEEYGPAIATLLVLDFTAWLEQESTSAGSPIKVDTKILPIFAPTDRLH